MSDWKSSLRSIIFVVLAASILLGLASGWVIPLRESSNPRRAALYRRGGDTLMDMYYLGRGVGWGEAQVRPFLEQAGNYYLMSWQADPKDLEISVSLSLALKALGRQNRAEYFLSLATVPAPPGKQTLVSALQAVVFSTHPKPKYIAQVRDYLIKLAPGPLTLANAYTNIGQPSQAEHDLKIAYQRANRLLVPLTIMFTVCGLMILTGLIFLPFAILYLIRASGKPMVFATPGWGVREAIEALILWIFCGLALSSLMGKRFLSIQEEGTALLLLPTLAAGAIAIGWVKLASPSRALLEWRCERTWRQVITGIGVAGLIALPIMGLYQLLGSVLGRIPSEHPLIPIFVTAPYLATRILLALMVCVVAPALEETLFRGILFKALRAQWAFPVAAIGSSAIFALGHLSPAGFIPYLLLGTIFSYLYERSGSLLAPTVAHGAFNAFNLAILLTLLG